ncbi:MAG: hypothetical protein FJW40_19030 [Acidobacteria bacterium]|nr:hypothetical protein [Acidobacteriota bacterium]
MKPEVRVDDGGHRIILDFPDLQGALALLRCAPTAAKRAELAAHIREAAGALGIALELQVRGRTVETFGAGEGDGLLTKLISPRAA